MANIIVTHFSGVFLNGRYKTTVFYEGLINSLVEQGNNVLHVITSNYLSSPWNGSNTPITAELGDTVLQALKDFKPDLVISFNNSSIAGIDKVLDCPIALWEADTFQFFNDKKYIKENRDRYHYLAFASQAVEDYKKELGLKDDRICRVPAATFVQNYKEEKLYNISFIGNTFTVPESVFTYLAKNPSLRHVNPNDLSVREQEFCYHSFEQDDFYDGQALFFRKSGQQRMAICNQLLSEGLHLFGSENWYSLGMLGDDILDAYDPRAVYSVKQNQLIYNRSRLSLNINHSQASSGFSWRVVDVLASDSVMLTTPSKDLNVLCKGKVELQNFESPQEAQEIARKLLKDPQHREEIIRQQNQLVEDSFRWPQRFQTISEFTGVDLLNNEEAGHYQELDVKAEISLPAQIFLKKYSRYVLGYKEDKEEIPAKKAKYYALISVFLKAVFFVGRPFVGTAIRLRHKMKGFLKNSVIKLAPYLAFEIRRIKQQKNNKVAQYE